MTNLDDAVIVALGSNLAGALGTGHDLLNLALGRMSDAGLRVVEASTWWRSAAWPPGPHPDYLNGVALVDTRLAPLPVLAILLRIEREFGRRRGEANAPRTLDLDLIAHGRRIMREPGLRLPHPRAAERRFVMGPLASIAPGWVHPELGRTARWLADRATAGVDAAPMLSPGG